MTAWFEALKAADWLPLVLAILPLIWLARRRIYPHFPLAVAFAVPFLLTLALVVNREFWPLVYLADAVLLAVAAGDLATLPRRLQLNAERRLLRVASIRQHQAVQLVLTYSGRGTLYLTVRDDLPQEFEASPSQFKVRLQGKTRVTLRYDFRSQERGEFVMRCVYLKTRSRFGFWTRYYEVPVENTVHVYPDMKQLAEYAVLARTNRLSLVGVRRTRRIGQDNEFERLRDYTVDDNYKHIDWRATARRRKLTVKDFQTNQSQRLMFMLDCGRMMTNHAAGLSLLDHALNAMLMLSYVALRQGDSVGLLCFSDTIHAFVPPRGGAPHMNRLLHASFDRFPRLVESRYDEAFLHLGSHCRKRSLVILITNVIDEVNANQVEQYLSAVVGKHLPLGVLLRDRSLFQAAELGQGGDRELYRAGAAAEILSWRHQTLTDLSHRGVLALDVFPEDMTAPLVNQYLNIKARHLL